MNDTHPPPVSPDDALRIDRACDRFEAAWKADRRPRPEEYLDGSGGPARSALLAQLLLVDWDYRRRAGEAPAAADYLARFPDEPAAVAAVGRAVAALDGTHGGPGGGDTPWPGGGPADAADDAGADGPRYELVEEVGRGGIGVVYRGRDRRLRRELAVKVLRESYRDRPDARRRFLAEARVGSQLQHPAIVPVYEAGTFADGRPYFTMKLVEGRTFAEVLRRADRGRDLTWLLGVFAQVCQAVAYAHARGVVHRDLKPANVMVGSFGEVQVMDWGFAKVLAGGDGPGEPARTGPPPAAASQSGTLMGTPAYMPPEQARGEVALIDPRADVFALGAILCEVLTGRPPYGGGTGDDVCRRAAAGDLADAVRRLDGCGADYALRDLARRCLAPVRSARPADAGAVAADLAAYLASARERLRQAELDKAAAEARAQSERRARRLTAAFAAAAVLLVAGAASAPAVGYVLCEEQKQSEAALRGLVTSQRQLVAETTDLDNRLDLAASLIDLGQLSQERGQLRDAEALSREALSLLGDRAGGIRSERTCTGRGPWAAWGRSRGTWRNPPWRNKPTATR